MQKGKGHHKLSGKGKKRKVYFCGFNKKFANENYLCRSPFLSWEKRSGDGQTAIKYKMRSRAM